MIRAEYNINISDPSARCGSLVLLTHDCADIFLELAKLLHYAKLNTLCDGVFGVFILVWTVTRLGVFPTWIFYR